MEPEFEIPTRPERHYPRDGGVEYEGAVVLRLRPTSRRDGDDALRELLDDVLDGDPYTHGDWFDLPVPVYLVRDREVGTSFRAAVRNGRIELHVLPGTEAVGLRRFYERLCEHTGDGWETDWSVDR